MKIMRKMFAVLCILSICIFAAPMVVAEENTTGEASEAGTNVTVGENLTESPAPTPTTASPETVSAEEGEKFRVGPTVKLRPVNDVITSGKDGLVELFISNPSLNDVTLHVDAYVSVPSGFHVTGEGFGQAGAAGTVYGQFDVPPGTARTIYINLKSEKVGTFMIHFSGMYYPGDNKPNYNPISLTHPMTVEEPSDPPKIDTPAKTVPEEGIRGQLQGIIGSEVTMSFIVLIAVLLGGVAIIFGMKRKPPKTEVNIEE